MKIRSKNGEKSRCTPLVFFRIRSCLFWTCPFLKSGPKKGTWKPSFKFRFLRYHPKKWTFRGSIQRFWPQKPKFKWGISGGFLSIFTKSTLFYVKNPIFPKKKDWFQSLFLRIFIKWPYFRPKKGQKKLKNG